MRWETHSGRLLLFVLLLGAATTVVVLRRQSPTENGHGLLAWNTRSEEGDSRENPAPKAKDPKSQTTEADSVWKTLVDARDRQRNRKPSLVPRRQASEIVQDESPEQFVDTPLRDALRFLQEQHGLAFWLDEPVLGRQKTLLDKEVNLSAEKVRLDWVLDRLLLPLNLDWIAERDLIRVTSTAEAAKHLEVRAYDVLDLVEAGFDEEMLTGLIEGCVHPESWSPSPDEETGLPRKATAKVGPQDKKEKEADAEPPPPVGRGRTRVANGVLVVWQTQRIHAQVVLFLDDLETILDDAEEDRRFDPHIVTIRHRRPAKSSRRLLLPR